MIKRIDPAGPGVTFLFEGEPICAQVGDSVAAALAEAGVLHLRETPAIGAPRSWYCMMGSCFECLVEVNGVSNCQACMTEVREGLAIRRQRGPAVLAR